PSLHVLVHPCMITVLISFLLFLMLSLPHTSTLFPYTTLFRSLRQKTISNNIANIDTPNYKAQDVVPFKKYLNQELKSGLTAKQTDRKSTRLNSSHVKISYAVFCLNKTIICPLTFIKDLNFS